ncbi:MAG: cyclic nucleotide-binding domain-containing protein [Myxococcota bacterium]|nr:cyclic nucleotide-binding domain-containing protein [Myxococcota bacterium]
MKIYDFVPRLVANIDFLKSEHQEHFIRIRNAEIIPISPNEYVFHDIFQRGLSLKEAIQEKLKSADRVPSTALVSLLNKLHQANAFTNPQTEIDSVGLVSDRRSLWRKLRRAVPHTFLFVTNNTPSTTFAKTTRTKNATPESQGVQLVTLGALVATLPSLLELYKNAADLGGQNWLATCLALYLGVVVALSFEGLGRLIWCRTHPQLHVEYGIGLRGIFLHLKARSTDSWTLGHDKLGQESAHGLQWMLVSSIGLQILTLVLEPPLASFVATLSIAAAMRSFASLCPFDESDGRRFLELAFPNLQYLDQTGAYIKRKYFQRLFVRNLFHSELRLLITLTACIGWFSIWLNLWTKILNHIILPNLLQILNNQSMVSFTIAVGVGGFSVVIVIFWLVWGLQIVSQNLIAWPKPTSQKEKSTFQATNAIDILQGCPILTNLSDSIVKELSKPERIKSYPPNTQLLQQGETGTRCFIVLHGTAEVFQEDSSGLRTTITLLGPSDCFGEIALLDNVTRTASVRACTDINAITIERKEFFELIETANLTKTQITPLLRLTQNLRKSDVFQAMHPKTMAGLLRKGQRKKIPAGSTVIQEGDKGSHFFVIATGAIQLTRQNDRSNVTLEAGDFFGEKSLLTSNPRSASAIATEESDLVCIDREDFQAALLEDLALNFQLEQIAMGRR